MSSNAGGPVDRIELLGAIIDDDRARLIHIRTARHILKRYFQKFGNARASVSYLQEVTGLTRGSVATATEDLVDWGYFTRIMGSGKRPTEYHPNFSVLSSSDDSRVLPSQDDIKSSVLQPQDERVLQPQDAKSGGVLQPQDQTLLLVSATAGDKVKDTSAPGSRAGPSAAGPRASVDRVVRVVRSEVELDGAEIWLNMGLEFEDGEKEGFAICLQSDEQEIQDRGQARYQRLLIALDIDSPEDPEAIVGIPFILTGDDSFRPLEAA